MDLEFLNHLFLELAASFGILEGVKLEGNLIDLLESILVVDSSSNVLCKGISLQSKIVRVRLEVDKLHVDWISEELYNRLHDVSFGLRIDNGLATHFLGQELEQFAHVNKVLDLWEDFLANFYLLWFVKLIERFNTLSFKGLGKLVVADCHQVFHDKENITEVEFLVEIVI